MTGDPAAAGSPRLALAAVAEVVVTRMPGVALTDGDGRWVTAHGDRRIRGVIAVAQSEGRYELELHVVVAWPPEPLPQLAQELRRRVLAAAKRHALAEQLGDIQIHIDSVQEPDHLHAQGPGS